MRKECRLRHPFFEIGPKSYLYGQDVIDLAVAADAASEKYDVDIIFTTPVVDVYKRQVNRPGQNRFFAALLPDFLDESAKKRPCFQRPPR